MKTIVAKIAGTLFVVWHVLILVVSPAPGSYAMSKLWPYVRPYVMLCHLENYWAFFAPNPSAGAILRYVVQDADGNVQWFKFTENLRRSSPRFLRHSSVQNDLEWPSPWYRWTFADWLSRHHADLNPRHVQYVICYQKPLYRTDWLAGHRPLQKDFMTLRYSEVIDLPVDFPALLKAQENPQP